MNIEEAYRKIKASSVVTKYFHKICQVFLVIFTYFPRYLKVFSIIFPATSRYVQLFSQVFPGRRFNCAQPGVSLPGSAISYLHRYF